MEFTCTHTFYRDGACRDIRFSPDTHSAAKFANYGIIFATLPDGFALYSTHQTAATLHQTDLVREKLTVRMEVQNPIFWQVTGLSNLPFFDRVFHFQTDLQGKEQSYRIEADKPMMQVIPVANMKAINGQDHCAIYLPKERKSREVPYQRIIRLYDGKTCQSFKDIKPEHGYRIQRKKEEDTLLYLSHDHHTRVFALVEVNCALKKPIGKKGPTRHQLLLKAKEVHWRYVIRDEEVINKMHQMAVNAI